MATLKKQWQDELQQANQNLQALNAQQPAAFSSENTALKNAALDAINNRQKFSYDVNADALYQQYKDKYLNLGKLAMQDTVGKTSALTGGYGNSYAQNAGQQAYQQYVTQLNDKIPELYSLAYSQYQDEGNDLKDRYKLYAQQEADDYDRYRDTVQDYNVNRNYWQGVGENAQNGLYKLSRDAVNDAQDLRNYNLKLGLDSKGNPITINNGTGGDEAMPASGMDVKTYNSTRKEIYDFINAGDVDRAIADVNGMRGAVPADRFQLAAEALINSDSLGKDERLKLYQNMVKWAQQVTDDSEFARIADAFDLWRFLDDDGNFMLDPFPDDEDDKDKKKAGGDKLGGGRRELAMISLKD